MAEQALELDCEISVMAARSPSGEVRSYPAARNHHENQILAWSVLPAGVPAVLESRAEALAAAIIERMGIEGLLCVEIFVTRQGELLVNELAPRPHNSYHQSERGCVTSQFEQAVRAVCNLPLGDTAIITPAAIVNLLGDVWLNGVPDFARPWRCPVCGCTSMKSTRRARAGRWAIYQRPGRPQTRHWSEYSRPKGDYKTRRTSFKAAWRRISTRLKSTHHSWPSVRKLHRRYSGRPAAQ